MKYIIAAAGTVAEFVDRVNGLMEEGWEPWGSPINQTHQAMVKHDYPKMTEMAKRFQFEYNPLSGEETMFYRAKNGEVYKIDMENVVEQIRKKQEVISHG